MYEGRNLECQPAMEMPKHPSAQNKNDLLQSQVGLLLPCPHTRTTTETIMFAGRATLRQGVRRTVAARPATRGMAGGKYVVNYCGVAPKRGAVTPVPFLFSRAWQSSLLHILLTSPLYDFFQ